jgi:hypothetical protein
LIKISTGNGNFIVIEYMLPGYLNCPIYLQISWLRIKKGVFYYYPEYISINGGNTKDKEDILPRGVQHSHRPQSDPIQEG